MTNDLLQAHLQRTEANIARGRRCIELMQVAITQNKLKGHDTEAAEKLMNSFKEIQTAHLQAAQRMLTAIRDLTH